MYAHDKMVLAKAKNKAKKLKQTMFTLMLTLTWIYRMYSWQAPCPRPAPCAPGSGRACPGAPALPVQRGRRQGRARGRGRVYSYAISLLGRREWLPLTELGQKSKKRADYNDSAGKCNPCIDLFIVLDILDFHRNHVVFGNSCRIKIFSIPRALGHKFLFIEVFWASCDINFVMPNAH